jgi:nucleoside-diphosphate-sugar epimerase
MLDTLLVTGATGHLGQRVLHHLADTLRVPGNRIIATTRKPESLSAWAVKGSWCVPPTSTSRPLPALSRSDSPTGYQPTRPHCSAPEFAVSVLLQRGWTLA